jgi:hypothetical protein
MAARKTRTLTEGWKQKIQTSMLINRLQDHVNGKIEMVPSQVTAALGLLKKTAPDLSSVAHGQDTDLPPIQHEIGLRPTLTREEWLKLHQAED